MEGPGAEAPSGNVDMVKFDAQGLILVGVCWCMLWGAACARRPHFDVYQREEILIEGETTAEALKSLLGEPASISTLPEGQLWIYRFRSPHEYAIVRLREARTLYIFIDTTGVVKTVSERLISKPE